MTVDTSKETGYAVQSTLPVDEVMVMKETGYVVQSFYPDDEVTIMKETCYVVLKPAAVSTSKTQTIIINM